MFSIKDAILTPHEESIYWRMSVIKAKWMKSLRHKHIWSEVAQLCLTLCDPVDCSPPGSSIHGILHARILEWVAISFSRGSSWPRDQTQVSHIAGRCFNLWATRARGLMDSIKYRIAYKTTIKWEATPVLLPGKSHGRRSLVGCSPWGR